MIKEYIPLIMTVLVLVVVVWLLKNYGV